MPGVTIEQLAHERGYSFAGKTKEAVKLTKDERTVLVDQELIDDIASLSSPIKTSDGGPIQGIE